MPSIPLLASPSMPLLLPARCPLPFVEWVVTPTACYPDPILLPAICASSAAPVATPDQPVHIHAKVIDSIDPVTAEVTSTPVFEFGNPRLAKLDPAKRQKLQIAVEQMLDHAVALLCEEETPQDWMSAGVAFSSTIKRLHSGRPEPQRYRVDTPLNNPAETTFRSDSRTADQQKRLRKLLADFGVSDNAQPSGPLWIDGEYKYELQNFYASDGGIVMSRRMPGSHRWFQGRLALSGAELRAVKADLDAQYDQAVELKNTRETPQKHARDSKIFVGRGDERPSSGTPLTQAMDDRIAEMNRKAQAAFFKGAQDYAERNQSAAR